MSSSDPISNTSKFQITQLADQLLIVRYIPQFQASSSDNFLLLPPNSAPSNISLSSSVILNQPVCNDVDIRYTMINYASLVKKCKNIVEPSTLVRFYFKLVALTIIHADSQPVFSILAYNSLIHRGTTNIRSLCEGTFARDYEIDLEMLNFSKLPGKKRLIPGDI
jgi:hypothetical protein